VNISVKLYLGDELRRFYFEGKSFEELFASCVNYVSPGYTPKYLQYQDDENEWVTFSSTPELQCALGLIGVSPSSLLRLKLIVVPTEAPVGLVPQNLVANNGSLDETFGEKQQNSGTDVLPFIPEELRTHGSGRGLRQTQTPGPKKPIVRQQWQHQGTNRQTPQPMQPKQRPQAQQSQQAQRQPAQQQAQVVQAPHKKLKGKLLDARFVSHVTIPCNSFFPGVTFEKTWYLYNSGQISWPPGSHLVCVDRMNSFFAQDTLLNMDQGLVAPGAQATASLILTSPPLPGLYQSYFKLRTPEGKKFGQRIRCQIFVADPTAMGPWEVASEAKAKDSA